MRGDILRELGCLSHGSYNVAVGVGVLFGYGCACNFYVRVVVLEIIVFKVYLEEF